MPLHSLHLGVLELRTWTLVGQVPFALLLVLLYLAGRRRGWPWRATALATAAFAAGLSLGTAMLPSVLGAAVGGIGLWLVAQRLMALRRPPLAMLAVGLAGLVAIGRWGCLLNGCCFGIPSELPWAIHYAAGSAPWLAHLGFGFLPPSATESLAVHPYPLYESVGLLVWIPIALHLARRLRSEGALLAFTAAWDLALRGFIDGTRAMINVWWGLLGSWLGLGLFQWTLLGCALALLGLGLTLERRARAVGRPAIEPASEPASYALWGVYAGLCIIGWATDAAQTLFLHRALVVSLVLSAAALRWPIRLRMGMRTRIWTAPAFAAALLLPLALRVERAAQAQGTGASKLDAGGARRGWLYDMDVKRGVIVRVGSAQESPEKVAERREALDLPPAARAPAPESSAGQTWIGGGAMGGKVNYRVEDSCNGDYTLYDRRAGGGWLEIDRQLPEAETSVYWLSGRGGLLAESRDVTRSSSSGPSGSSSLQKQICYGQFFAEWEHPNVAIGAGIMATQEWTQQAGLGSGSTQRIYPAAHLRAGASFLSLDAGMFDRQSFLGYPSYRLGVSGAFGSEGRIRHPNDKRVRFFVGVVTFPGTDFSTGLAHAMLGSGLELYLSRRLVLGLGMAAGDGLVGNVHLRTRVGD